MLAQEVETRIKTKLQDAEVKVEGEDCSFAVVVLSESFRGMPVVRRQQTVLAAFSDVLQTGELHALSVKAHTPEEWRSFQQGSLTQIEM
ncbi:MAG: BolA/IbaG family iron-sulfur metabolism protein [Pseudomonadota bacterium]|nr:hypothetical protein [Pseudomonadales bacterium]MDY6921308.1 BolA/IbaG family iron-sulfur metabolism protein [Pseudomonadota bacterium]|tara:strand:+ start:188 stop:454 length:267 start_codon:yes stop_codon:yes gene_type:complete